MQWSYCSLALSHRIKRVPCIFDSFKLPFTAPLHKRLPMSPFSGQMIHGQWPVFMSPQGIPAVWQLHCKVQGIVGLPVSPRSFHMGLVFLNATSIYGSSIFLSQMKEYHTCINIEYQWCVLFEWSGAAWLLCEPQHCPRIMANFVPMCALCLLLSNFALIIQSYLITWVSQCQCSNPEEYW